MKNLLLAFLLLMSVTSIAQVTVTQDPFEVSPGTTSTVEVNLPVSSSFLTVLTIKMKSTNVGTVDGSGNIDIVMTQTTNNASICMVGFILMIYP